MKKNLPSFSVVNIILLRVRSRAHAVKLCEKLLKDNYIAPLNGNTDATFCDGSKEVFFFIIFFFSSLVD